MNAISLFACGGIGDLALRHAGFNVVVANELIPERAEVFKYNYPESKMLVGDIWELKNDIVTEAKKIVGQAGIDLVFATPPCQGMSKNGRGKLLSLIRNGKKEAVDPRNLLVIPTVEVFLKSGAHTLVMENVPEMENTFIPQPNSTNQLIGVVEYVKQSLGAEYLASVKVIEFADFGVPQSRQRLISIFTKNQALKEFFKRNGYLHPKPTHSCDSQQLPRWRTLRDVIGHLPTLDASTEKSASHPSIPFHRVPLLDREKYFWVSNTPEAGGAFDNQCVNPNCMYQGNKTHSASKTCDGINRASVDTPIRCEKCGELLPRPWVKEGDTYRLMKGYTSAYKRMRWDFPCPTLTRNLSYACSDNKLHPDQHRVLSLHEAMIIHTVADYDYHWKRPDGKKVSDKVIRELIGESIPPAGLESIFRFIKGILTGKIKTDVKCHSFIQKSLF